MSADAPHAGAGQASSEGGFDLLVVCTGNICRSPMGELMARHGIDRRLGPEQAARFRVHSAGTHGLTDWEINPPAAAQLTRLGITSETFRARRMDADHVRSADLVLTATREHRSAAVTLEPRAVQRTFTIRELVRLLALVDPAEIPDASDASEPLDPAARARVVIAAAATKRGLRYAPPDEDDVADPYQLGDAAFEACATQIAEAIDAILDGLVGPVITGDITGTGETAQETLVGEGA